jgi:hypothetical protein
MAAEPKSILYGEPKEYRAEEFVRKVGKRVFSKHVTVFCENAKNWGILSQLRSQLIRQIADFECGKYPENTDTEHGKDIQTKLIVDSWNKFLWSLGPQTTFPKFHQAFVHPMRPYLVCEMDHFEIYKQQDHVNYKEDLIMINLQTALKTYVYLFGDGFQKRMKDSRCFDSEQIELFNIIHESTSFTAVTICQWHDPFRRAALLAQWKVFLEKTAEQIRIRIVTPMRIEFDTKYHDTMNDKIQILNE